MPVVVQLEAGETEDYARIRAIVACTLTVCAAGIPKGQSIGRKALHRMAAGLLRTDPEAIGFLLRVMELHDEIVFSEMPEGVEP